MLEKKEIKGINKKLLNDFRNKFPLKEDILNQKFMIY